MKTRTCKCDMCTKWNPLARRILAKLRGNDKALFNEWLEMEAQQGDDLAATTAKLDGSWPGYEWLPAVIEQKMSQPNCPQHELSMPVFQAGVRFVWGNGPCPKLPDGYWLVRNMTSPTIAVDGLGNEYVVALNPSRLVKIVRRSNGLSTKVDFNDAILL